MAMGIIVCGLNGSGKSTIGKALAEKLGSHFIDIEDLYFPKTDLHDIYGFARSREEVEQLLLHEVSIQENFILAAVKGDYGTEILPFYRCVVLLEAPRGVRLRRIQNRSFLKFGDRMLPGGDLYEREKAFFERAMSRSESDIEDWVSSLHCPVICADGTKSVEDTIGFLLKELKRLVEN